MIYAKDCQQVSARQVLWNCTGACSMGNDTCHKETQGTSSSAIAESRQNFQNMIDNNFEENEHRNQSWTFRKMWVQELSKYQISEDKTKTKSHYSLKTIF